MLLLKHHQSAKNCTSIIIMKFLIVAFALVAVAAAQFQQEQRPIAILRQAGEVNPDGSYQYNYETENGIVAGEQGQPRVQGPEGPAVAAQGQYSYTAPDGQQFQVSYVADENGFQPQGAHLPTPPPVPEEILRSIEYNLAHPEENQQ